jgi:hypothetical protein
MALAKIVFETLRIADLRSQTLRPAIGDRDETGIERVPQFFHESGQWIAEIFVFPSAEPVPGHADMGPEKRIVVVKRCERGALIFGE